jgi:hypothetical protein
MDNSFLHCRMLSSISGFQPQEAKNSLCCQHHTLSVRTARNGPRPHFWLSTTGLSKPTKYIFPSKFWDKLPNDGSWAVLIFSLDEGTMLNSVPVSETFQTSHIHTVAISEKMKWSKHAFFLWGTEMWAKCDYRWFWGKMSPNYTLIKDTNF